MEAIPNGEQTLEIGQKSKPYGKKRVHVVWLIRIQANEVCLL